MKVLIMSLIFLVLPWQLQGATADVVLKNEKIGFFTPNILNTKYFAFEFGYLTQKKINRIGYHYNAYAEAFLAEESYTTAEQLRSGALGFKGGVLMPLTPWYSIFWMGAIGYAKTSFHHDPWFGDRDESVSTRDMFLLETGLLFSWNTFLIRYVYQISNVKYFTRNTMLSLGVNF